MGFKIRFQRQTTPEPTKQSSVSRSPRSTFLSQLKAPSTGLQTGIISLSFIQLVISLNTDLPQQEIRSTSVSFSCSGPSNYRDFRKKGSPPTFHPRLLILQHGYLIFQPVFCSPPGVLLASVFQATSSTQFLQQTLKPYIPEFKLQVLSMQTAFHALIFLQQIMVTFEPCV